MTAAPLGSFRATLPSLLAATLALALLHPLPASAQGSSRFDSMFNDARRFLDRQLKKLDDMPQRGAVRRSTVPLPPRNPRRPTELAGQDAQPPQAVEPAQPIQTPEPAQKTVDAREKIQPPPILERRKPYRRSAGPGIAMRRTVAPKPGRSAGEEKSAEIAEASKPGTPGSSVQSEPKAPSGTADGVDAATPEARTKGEKAAETASVEPLPGVPIRNPARTGEYKPPPPHPSEIEAPDWTEKQIAEAKAQCDKLLSKEILKFKRLDPIRTGICGTPAPVKLTSIEAGSTVKIAPAATLTCPLAAALRRWMNDVVQPAAKQHLGSPIASIRNVASYSCRNRYGGARRPLSEHAKVNAIDIAAFKTESGETIILLKDWNLMIQPEPRVARTELVDSADKETDSTKASDDSSTNSKKKEAAAPNGEAAGSTQSSADKSAATDGETKSNGEGNKVEDEEPPIPKAKPKHHPKSLFLRAIHDGACGIFGTVLGPASNAAHRDHFHFDGAERRRSYCE